MNPSSWRLPLRALFLVGLLPAQSLSQAPFLRELEKTRAELLRLHNQERKSEDLKPLRMNAELTKAAQAYAEYLAESGAFSHTAKGTPRSRIKDAGYAAKAGGENIAIGQPTAAAVIKNWLESETHKDNILSDEFTEVGFGIAQDKNGDLIWVTDFGDR